VAIDKEYLQQMNLLAKRLDEQFNGDLDVKPRTVGFALLVFPLNEPLGGRVNYISNADRASMVVALKELLARWEGQPEVRGRA
jgi:hypothetical protein